VDAASARVSTALDAALTTAGVTHAVARAGNLFSASFRASEPRNYAEAQAQESFRYAPFFHSLREQGVALPPSVFEAWFLTAAHGEQELQLIEAALPAAAAAAAAARP
jgi:glutamate-1-semialdehyde 2,1-aminomutase